MPLEFTAYLTTTASATVEVTLTDEELAEAAAGYGVTVEELDDEMLRTLVEEKAITENSPSTALCVHCSGYGKTWSLDLGDVWEPDDKAAPTRK